MSVDYTKLDGPELLRECGTNAGKWAAAFRQMAIKLGYSDMDEGWLVGWFSNAMMNMVDQGVIHNGDHAQYLIDRGLSP